MQLISLKANESTFRTVNFNKSGLSFIVAQQKNPGESERGKTYNGVGKSLLVAIIHFCLGANKEQYKSFTEKLPGWIFTLDFQIGEDKYSAARATSNIDKIILNDEMLSITKFNERLESLCFDIPSDTDFLTFRALLPFFIRPKKESYISFDSPAKTGFDYQKQIYNAFLLGLDVQLAQEKYKIRKEQERIKKLTDNIKKDNLLKEFFSGGKDVTLSLQDLNDKITRLKNDLIKFKVAEDYYETKSKADDIERILAKTQNEVTLIENQIRNINESLKISPDLSKKNIEKAYNEVQIVFSDKVSKTIDQLELFYKQLTENRIRKLTKHKQDLTRELESKKRDASKLKSELDVQLQYLGAHQALDIFVKVNNQLSSLKNERDSLQKYKKLLDEYHKKNIEEQESLLKSTKKTDDYLKDVEDIIDSIRDYFRNLAKKFYPDAASGITIYNNEGDNQIRYDIKAKIEADTADGINHVKIFCYDITLLFKGYGHLIHFLFHDSRIFSEIDERQKTELFRIVDELFSNSNYQYIATVNQNQLKEIQQYMTEDEFDRIIKKNTVLTLTDDSSEEKLLGIKVDLEYE